MDMTHPGERAFPGWYDFNDLPARVLSPAHIPEVWKNGAWTPVTARGRR